MGHIADIPVVQEQMSLDAVVLIPSKIHQVKHAEDKQTIFTPAQRMGMALLAAEQYSNVYVSPSDLEAPEAVTRTDITLRRIHAEVGNEPGDKILWIAGFDSLESLPHWADPNTVLKLASFIVVPRNGKGLAQIDTLGHQHPDLFPLTVITELKENFVQVPELPISSSELKRDLLAGRPLGNQVPDKVAEYLQTL